MDRVASDRPAHDARQGKKGRREEGKKGRREEGKKGRLGPPAL
jgi:hypothetical protein